MVDEHGAAVTFDTVDAPELYRFLRSTGQNVVGEGGGYAETQSRVQDIARNIAYWRRVGADIAETTWIQSKKEVREASRATRGNSDHGVAPTLQTLSGINGRPDADAAAGASGDEWRRETVRRLRRKLASHLLSRTHESVTALLCFSHLFVFLLYCQVPDRDAKTEDFQFPIMKDTLDTFALIFAVYWFLEVGARIFAFRWGNFWHVSSDFFREFGNRFDLVISALSILGLVFIEILSLEDVRGREVDKGKLQRIASLIQLLRLFSSIRVVRTTFFSILQILPMYKHVLGLVFLIVYFFNTLGVIMLSGRFQFLPVSYYDMPEANFNSFLNGFFTLYLMFIGEAWNDVMAAAEDVSPLARRWVVMAYFFAYVFLLTIIFANLLIGVIINGYASLNQLLAQARKDREIEDEAARELEERDGHFGNDPSPHGRRASVDGAGARAGAGKSGERRRRRPRVNDDFSTRHFKANLLEGTKSVTRLIFDTLQDGANAPKRIQIRRKENLASRTRQDRETLKKNNMELLSENKMLKEQLNLMRMARSESKDRERGRSTNRGAANGGKSTIRRASGGAQMGVVASFMDKSGGADHPQFRKRSNTVHAHRPTVKPKSREVTHIPAKSLEL